MSDDDIYERNAVLDERLADDPNVIDRLVAQARSNRFVSRLALTLVVAVIILGAVVGVFIAHQQSTSDQVDKNEAGILQAQVIAEAAARATIVACEVSNETRTGERELWDYILGLGASPGKEQQAADVREIVGRIFAQRECNIPLDPTPAPTTTNP